MRSAFALRIFRGKFVFISRLSHSAECDKRHFHKWGRRGKLHLQFESAILPLRLPREKAFQPSPQAWLKCKLKNNSAIYAQSNAERIQNHFTSPQRAFQIVAPPSCNFGAKGVEYSHNQIQGSS